MTKDRSRLGALTVIVATGCGALGCSLIRDFSQFEGDAGVSVDAGGMDAGSVDAGSGDGGVDGGARDAGASDAGTSDAGASTDAGADAGADPPDGGSPCIGGSCPAYEGWYVYSEPPPLAPGGSFSGALMHLSGSTLREGPCFPACGGVCVAPYRSGCASFPDHILVLTNEATATFSTTETYDISISIDAVDASHNLSGRTMSAGFPNTFTMEYLGATPP